MGDNDPKVPQVPPISEIEQAPDFKQVYCNHIRLSMTPYDFVLTCGQIIDKTPNNPIVREDAAVRFSPQQCKFLALNLTAAVAAWEAQWGTINVKQRSPEEIMKALQESAQKLKKEAFSN